MHSLYKFLFLVLAACVLLSCDEEKNNQTIKLSSNITQSFEGFVRDTSAYVMVVDTSVHDSTFNEKITPVKRGGFAEYFSRKAKYEGSNGSKAFYAYSDSISPFVKGSSESPSFFDVVALAYAKHYSLEINPDDIWLMILDGFRLHVKNNREKLKDRFVAPGTDTSIAVMDNSLTLESTHKEWFWTIANLFDSLQAKLPPETGEPLKIKFSTTSPVDYNISRTMTMAVASQYYSYNVYTLCGIPKIRINGTKDDWMLLKDSFNRLAEQLDMKWWSKGLNPILDEFVNTFDGKINLKHWKNIYKSFKPEGCGNPLFNGWISRFLPYTKDDRSNEEKYVKHTNWNEQLDFYNIPKGITFVDVQWNYLGEKIPLKLYTGFIGIQVDTTANRLKASRGYALLSFGLQNLKDVAQNVKFIPGKPLRLHEALSIADSMNIYGEKGLLYATHDFNEIEEFAKRSYFDEEYPEAEPWQREMVGVGEPNLSINLYADGKLIDHLLYYARPKNENFWMRLYDYFQSDYDGALLSLQGVGRWKKNVKIKEFFKQRNIPISGIVNEFPHEASLPKINVEIFVDTIFLKKGVKVDEKINMSELKSGVARALKNSLGWQLKRLLYRYYKDVDSLSVVAGLCYGDDGSVFSVSAQTYLRENTEFRKEIKSILKYGWMPPKVHSNIGNDVTAQEIVFCEKIFISFSRDYRMVCKQNGRTAKDSVEIVNAPDARKDVCNEITFSKDIATGEVIRYECLEYEKKLPSGSSQKNYMNHYFDKNKAIYEEWDRMYMPILRRASLKIPPCFVEEKIAEKGMYNEDWRF